MKLYIKSEHDDGSLKATGPLCSLKEAEKMMDRIAKVESVMQAQCWYVDKDGAAVGGPIFTYTKDELVLNND